MPLPHNPGGEDGIQKLLPEICEFAEVASYAKQIRGNPGDLVDAKHIVLIRTAKRYSAPLLRR